MTPYKPVPPISESLIENLTIRKVKRGDIMDRLDLKEWLDACQDFKKGGFGTWDFGTLLLVFEATIVGSTQEIMIQEEIIFINPVSHNNLTDFVEKSFLVNSNCIFGLAINCITKEPF